MGTGLLGHVADAVLTSSSTRLPIPMGIQVTVTELLESAWMQFKSSTVTHRHWRPAAAVSEIAEPRRLIVRSSWFTPIRLVADCQVVPVLAQSVKHSYSSSHISTRKSSLDPSRRYHPPIRRKAPAVRGCEARTAAA